MPHPPLCLCVAMLNSLRTRIRAMIVLGIETSCDETAASVVGDSPAPRILANVVRAQLDEHRPYGGVVPEIAARAHLDVLDALIAKALADGRDRLSRPRRRRLHRRAGPHRRRHRRDDGGEGDRARPRQEARRGQPSRGPCAHRAPDRRRRLSLSPAARLRRPLPAPHRRGRRALCQARHDDRRRGGRGLRQDGEAARPGLSRRAAARARGAGRAIPRASRCRGRSRAGRAATSRFPGSRPRSVTPSPGGSRRTDTLAAQDVADLAASAQAAIGDSLIDRTANAIGAVPRNAAPRDALWSSPAASRRTRRCGRGLPLSPRRPASPSSRRRSRSAPTTRR